MVQHKLLIQVIFNNETNWLNCITRLSRYLKSKRDNAQQPSEHLFIDSNKRYVDNQTEHDCR